MKVSVLHNNISLVADLKKPLDISIPLVAGEGRASAWYVPPIEISPVMTEQFTGSIELGGAVNFRNISFNPHGHGTHTECLGHITKDVHSINKTLTSFFSIAQLISIEPREVKESNDWSYKGDKVITLGQLEKDLTPSIESLIVRTKPNDASKKTKCYNDSNPCYFDPQIALKLIQEDVKHLLIDLPSVDREQDGGVLDFHHKFWEVPENPNFDRTITEMIYAANTIKDGLYLLELQVAPFENDASPSRPVLYKLH